MFIQYISIENFGSISSYETVLTPGLNIVAGENAAELAAAIGFLICNRESRGIPACWLQKDTRISAQICLSDSHYTVSMTMESGNLWLSATDPKGADVTARYQYALAHCREQDGVEVFDGADTSIPLRLYQYYCRDERDDLTDRTERWVDTETFHRYLHRYIHNFSPESINSKKDYRLTVNPQGLFEVFCPGASEPLTLSETEQKLFRYICFLNIAEFWANIEKIRDLHHEKKPLLIWNFIEYLDESADIHNLIARTQELRRQIILLTIPAFSVSTFVDNYGIYCAI